MATYATKQSDIVKEWHHIDAKGKVLGAIATEISTLLQGKDKVNYVTYLNCGDKVVVTNAKHVALTGTKELNKVYYSHSGYVGNLKTENVAQIRARRPEKLIYEAVNGMLPKNKLRKQRMANLYIFADEDHPHKAQFGGSK